MSPSPILPPRERRGRKSKEQGAKTKPMKSSKSSKTAKPKSAWRTFFKTLSIVVIAIIVLAGGAAAYLYNKADEKLAEISTVAANETPTPPEESAKVKPISFLILGVDTRGEGGTLNTDVFMVATLNPVTKSATLVSIPRDTRVQIEGYKVRKVNQYYAAFYMDEKETADKEIKEMVSKYMDIPIDYVVRINFQGFVDVIDAIGGVDVNVDMDMRYQDLADKNNPTRIDLKQGLQTLNGEDALGFVRYRKPTPGAKNPTKESNDFDRNRRQDEVLHEIVRKLQTFNGLTKIPDVIDAVGKNLKMDVPKDQIKDLITTYFTINKDKITLIPLEGTWKSPYVYLDEAKFEEAKQALKQELTEK